MDLTLDDKIELSIPLFSSRSRLIEITDIGFFKSSTYPKTDHLVNN